MSAEVLSLAESELSFPLPRFVQSVYREVADGGFGPGYGLRQLRADDVYSVVNSAKGFQKARLEDARCDWPNQFVSLCSWGCNIFSGIDCSRDEAPVIRFDPERVDWDGTEPISKSLVPEADSLEEWLTAWLDGERLFDRVK